MSQDNYQRILRERAEGVLLPDDKALSPAEYQNKKALKDYATRKLRHHCGLKPFHVERRSWWRRWLS